MLPQAAQAIRWSDGPATVELAGVATLKVPEGYRFVDARGARTILERQRGNVPQGIAGLLEAASGGGTVILEYVPIGYIKTYANEKINAEAVLADIQSKIALQNSQRAKLGYAPMKSVSWEHAPVVDSSDNTLESTFRIDLGSASMLNHSIRKFGRQGVIVATSQASSEPVSLKELMAGLDFKEGMRYADYQSGDKTSSLDITQLLTGLEFPTVPQRGWAKLSKATIMWSICGIGAVVLALVGFLVTKEIRDLKQQRSFEARLERSSVNGKRVNGHKSRHAMRRKREFDYQRFYTDMMMQVSGRATSQPSTEVEPEKTVEVHATAENHASQAVTSELIAQQKEFIEEQRRLMVQQARLIEERSRLIEEKNRILAKQSEMIESQLL